MLGLTRFPMIPLYKHLEAYLSARSSVWQRDENQVRRVLHRFFRKGTYPGHIVKTPAEVLAPPA